MTIFNTIPTSCRIYFGTPHGRSTACKADKHCGNFYDGVLKQVQHDGGPKTSCRIYFGTPHGRSTACKAAQLSGDFYDGVLKKFQHDGYIVNHFRDVTKMVN